MKNETHPLWSKDEYTYPVTGEFIPNIVTYIHDETDKQRPAMVVVPGGGYSVVSPTEAELVAKEFYQKGFNAFVLTYTTNLLKKNPLKMQPLKDLSKAVMYIRKNAEKFRIISDKLAICGFSAGGHLCGSLAVHYGMKELELDPEYEGINNRPDAVILSYPVITSGEYAHRDSFVALLGSDATKEELEYMSLEKQVSKDTPPIFIWHTATDDSVPVENSYLFAHACQTQNVTYEHHVFGNGKHGLSLANEDWANGNYGSYYTMQQEVETLEYYIQNKMELPPHFQTLNSLPSGVSIKDKLIQNIQDYATYREPDEGISIWPILAHHWLKKMLSL